MGNLPYHRKYRPNSIDKYVGNAKAKEEIMKLLASEVKPQVYLFSGSSGCGKTTFARLLAKEYNCLNRDPVKGACGCCENCLAIDDYIATGNSENLMVTVNEIDITKQSSKSSLEATLEEMLIPAFGDEWKVYILDECHRADQGLQNRLLKIVEEPPEHVLILFCTTDPDKLIDTLKSRCQAKIRITKPTVKELSSLLREICETEDVNYDQKGLDLIARRNELTIRNSLTGLENVINVKGDATYASVSDVFDTVSTELIVDYLRALKNNDPHTAVITLEKVNSKWSLDVFLKEMQTFVQRGIFVIHGCKVEGLTDNDYVVYRSIFTEMGVGEIATLLKRLINMQEKSMQSMLMDLISFAYDGLSGVNYTAIAEPVSDEDHTLASLMSVENEVTQENKVTEECKQQKAEDEVAQSLENSKWVNNTLSLQDLISGGAASPVG